jgi:hypothetical protein
MTDLRDRYGFAGLTLYSALSLLFFGRGLLGHFSERYMGFGPDPALCIDILMWWPYALTHRINPLFITTLWAPVGFNLTRATCFPLAALIVSPITIFFGPVAAYNTIMLACPALSAWTTFLLCRYRTSEYWPSIVGGYIFGFSAYMLGHIIGNIHFACVFLVPVTVYAVLRLVDGTLAPRRFVLCFTLLLIGQFLLSLEILAILTVFGGAALAISYGTAEKKLRDSIRSTLPLLACAYTFTGVLMSPYLIYFFVPFRLPAVPLKVNSYDVIAPLNLYLPTALNMIGHYYKPQVSWLGTGYVGIPMFIAIGHYAYSQRMDSKALMLVLFFLIVCILSLGPTFSYGLRVVPLPWAGLFQLPLINMAMPSRFTFLAFLSAALIVSFWLRDSRILPSLRILAAVAIVVSLLPNPLKSFWYTQLDTPTFFSKGLYKEYLSPNDNIIVLPYGFEGDSQVWQAVTGMYFRMAGGDISLVSYVPQELQHWKIIFSFHDLGQIPDEDDQLKAFLVQNDIRAIVVVEGKHFWRPIDSPMSYRRTAYHHYEKERLRSLLSVLHVAPIEVGGVSIYKVPLNELTPYRSLDPTSLEERADIIQLNTLIVAAASYFDRGLTIDPSYPERSLNLDRLTRMGLLPRAWFSEVGWTHDSPFWPALIENGICLDAFRDGRVAVGVLGSKEGLARLSRKYKPNATDVALMPPRDIGTNADNSRWLLVVLYDRQALSHAAQLAKTELGESAKQTLAVGLHPNSSQ